MRALQGFNFFGKEMVSLTNNCEIWASHITSPQSPRRAATNYCCRIYRKSSMPRAPPTFWPSYGAHTTPRLSGLHPPAPRLISKSQSSMALRVRFPLDLQRRRTERLTAPSGLARMRAMKGRRPWKRTVTCLWTHLPTKIKYVQQAAERAKPKKGGRVAWVSHYSTSSRGVP